MDVIFKWKKKSSRFFISFYLKSNSALELSATAFMFFTGQFHEETLKKGV
jgi:hypothetical protein